MELIGQAGLTGIFLVDLGVGVVFAMLVFSLVASAINEAVARLLNLRGAGLRRAISRLVRDETLRAALIAHPLIAGLAPPAGAPGRLAGRVLPGAADAGRMPPRIPRAAFARALVEVLLLRRDALVRETTDRVGHAGAAVSAALGALDSVIDALALDARTRARLREVLAGLDLAAEGADAALSRSVARLETDLADWFDAAMDRVTRWYLGRTRVMLFVIGALSALAVNFDVIGHVGRLAEDEALRRAVLARAGAALETGAVVGLPATAPAPEAADPVGASGEAIRMLAGDGGGALGWAGAAPAGPLDWLRRVASWLLVGLACTLGGPFWFDLLRALLRLRAGAVGLGADLERLRRALGGRASGDRHARGREPSGAPAVPAPAAPDPVAASGDAAPGRPG